ncbi:diguanylate phosphodiesterase [Pseudoalteromonas luteoviolacea S4047-1]|uniref:Diguanylate phosphodiesterase n=2 Tax=Pseudoalteromonas luteoviolacea TaxID=43657 RepID=A0A0F6AA27_9GAMM|nr:diguanylate phosphodiesterase [Pseudoalteromonas luteoviolacea S4054]KZN72335.1 diguanylate phosphodiesterase [Pseudoalteromonas luteoviolacea S4047-1]
MNVLILYTMVYKKNISNLLALIYLFTSSTSVQAHVLEPLTNNNALLVLVAVVCLTPFFIMLLLNRRATQKLDHLRMSEKWLKSTVEGSGDTLWDWNIQSGDIIRINDKYALNEEKSSHFIPNARRIHPQDIPLVEKQLKLHFAEKTAFFEASYRLRDNLNQYHWVLDKGKVISKDDNLNPLRMTGTVRDINHLKSTEERLNLFAKCVESLTDAIAIYDHNFKLVDLNPSYIRVFGGKRAQYVDSDFQLPGYDTRFIRQIKSALKETEHWQEELKIYDQKGNMLPIEVSIDEIKNSHGHVTNYVVVFSDLTERKKAESQLHNLSNRDRITGLPNRNLFFTNLKKLSQQGTHHALLVFDLDNFKKINDSLGHQLGDSLLSKLAMRLNKLCRQQDTFYRLGGDEFALVMSGTNDIHTITKVAKQFLAAIATPFKMANHELVITSSVGIVLFPEDGKTPEILLKNADTAMYHAKQKGNHYLFFNDSMNEQAVKRLQIENLMRFGLKEDHFVVYYQPKMDIRTGKLVGMEALVRFITPKKGIISPGVFIPIAEETGQIIEIGEVVLDKACKDVKRWVDKGLFNGRVAVNLSAKQFSLPDLTARIDIILQKNQLPSYFLELEITEGTVMDDPQEAISIMRSLNSRGIHLAMDDFGTGYSSLAYLKQFPLNTLKVDKAFIDDMGSERGRNMVDSIVTIAHNLDLHVVAEGVEEEEQLALLKQLECQTIQGYYYSKPLSSDEFERFLQSELENKPSLQLVN